MSDHCFVAFLICKKACDKSSYRARPKGIEFLDESHLLVLNAVLVAGDTNMAPSPFVEPFHDVCNLNFGIYVFKDLDWKVDAKGRAVDFPETKEPLAEASLNGDNVKIDPRTLQLVPNTNAVENRKPAFPLIQVIERMEEKLSDDQKKSCTVGNKNEDSNEKELQKLRQAVLESNKLQQAAFARMTVMENLLNRQMEEIQDLKKQMTVLVRVVQARATSMP